MLVLIAALAVTAEAQSVNGVSILSCDAECAITRSLRVSGDWLFGTRKP